MQFESLEDSFRLSARSEEAAAYIEQALLQGGWNRAATNPYTYAGDVQEGLSINFMQTMEHSQKPSGFRILTRLVCRTGLNGFESIRKIPYSMLVLSMVESGTMETARKITVEVPEELLEKAQEASGEGITQTVRTGLQLVAASRTYARLRQLRGKVRFTRTLAELKADR